MKKLLIGTSALVAAGLMSAPAIAADPIKIAVGGFQQEWIGTSTQDSTYTNAGGASVQSTDIKGDSELFFSGSTKLDNGLTVGVRVEIESDQSITTQRVDHSTISVNSATLGTVTMGSTGASISGVSVPNEGYHTSVGYMSGWAPLPTNVQNGGNAPTAFGFEIEDDTAITYKSPSFAGFQAGFKFHPAAGDNSKAQPNDAGTVEKTGLSLQYAGKFDSVSINGYTDYVKNSTDATLGANGTQPTSDNWNTWTVGASVSVAGFTLGGTYLETDVDDKLNGAMAAFDGHTYRIGLGYKTGPYGFSYTNFTSEIEGTTTAGSGDDEVVYHSLGMTYNMGAGITTKAFATSFDYNDETALAANNNSGHILGLGITASF